MMKNEGKEKFSVLHLFLYHIVHQICGQVRSLQTLIQYNLSIHLLRYVLGYIKFQHLL